MSSIDLRGCNEKNDLSAVEGNVNGLLRDGKVRSCVKCRALKCLLIDIGGSFSNPKQAAQARWAHTVLPSECWRGGGGRRLGACLG